MLVLAMSPALPDLPFMKNNPHVKPARLSCKSVSSCEDAVALWCGGYSRADGDSDGIPCENVCSSVSEVDKIRGRIGC